MRDSCGDNNCAVDLEVNAAMVQLIRENLDSLSKTSVHKHFVARTGSTREIPPFPGEANYERAKSIGRALMKTAVWDRDLVRTAASAYAYGVHTSDKLLVLAAPEDARFGRALILTVRHMQLKSLQWKIVGFDTDEIPRPLPKTVPKEWCKRLTIPSNTRIKWVIPKNKSNSASANQIAVEVVEQVGSSQEVSSNFHSVMLVANVIEMWRLAPECKHRFRKERT